MPLARVRENKSAAPPAANGTTSLIGLAGNGCAHADGHSAARKTRSNRACRFIWLPDGCASRVMYISATFEGATRLREMTEPSSSTVTVRDCRIRLMRGGAGQPVLFLHGGGGLPSWLPFLAQLAEKFDLLVPEHPGFGQSEMPDWLDSVSDLANFYLDFLEELDL